MDFYLVLMGRLYIFEKFIQFKIIFRNKYKSKIESNFYYYLYIKYYYLYLLIFDIGIIEGDIIFVYYYNFYK